MTGDRPAATDVNAVIDAHERSGYRLAVDGVETFVLDLGHGQPVVCLHGVPASSFLYRKLIVELAHAACAASLSTCRGWDLRSGPRPSTTPGPALAGSHPPRSKASTWIGSIWWCTISERRWGSSLRRASGPSRLADGAERPVEVDTFHRPWVMKPFAVKDWARCTFGCSTRRPSGG